MGVTQGVCILFGTWLTQNFLNTDEQIAASEKHWIKIGTADLNQSNSQEMSWLQNGS